MCLKLLDEWQTVLTLILHCLLTTLCLNTLGKNGKASFQFHIILGQLRTGVHKISADKNYVHEY